MGRGGPQLGLCTLASHQAGLEGANMLFSISGKS